MQRYGRTYGVLCRVTFLAAVASGCGATASQISDQVQAAPDEVLVPLDEVLSEKTLELRISWESYLAAIRDQQAREMSGVGHGVLLAGLFESSTELVRQVVNLANERPLIGYIYRIEGYQHGQRVVYIGSAASIKKRLMRYKSKHSWTKLLQQKSTVVHVKKVYGNLDINASGQKSLRSARNEALRSMEEPELKREEKRAERENRRRAPGQKRAKIGNVDRAASEPDLWQKRHNTIRDANWRRIKRPGNGIKLPHVIGAVLLILEGYRMYVEDKKSRYVMAPYVLEDDDGAFTMFEQNGFLNGAFSTTYYKRYIAGPYKGKKVQVHLPVWLALAQEAVAVWGMLDNNGDFIPGLLRPTLPVFNPYIARVARSVVGATVDPTR